MPGTDKPKHPRPKEVEFTEGGSSWINCGEEVEEGTEIFDFVGANDSYGDYEPTASGEYPYGPQTVEVTNGIITSVS